MDLMRQILLALESDIGIRPKTYSFQNGVQKQSVEGYSDEEVYGHFLMVIESPSVEGNVYQSGDILIRRLTWEGREFLDAVRGDNIWKKTKAEAEQIGGVGMAFAWERAHSFDGLLKCGITPIVVAPHFCALGYAS